VGKGLASKLLERLVDLSAASGIVRVLALPVVAIYRPFYVELRVEDHWAFPLMSIPKGKR
jgi:hypothetical protein